MYGDGQEEGGQGVMGHPVNGKHHPMAVQLKITDELIGSLLAPSRRNGLKKTLITMVRRRSELQLQMDNVKDVEGGLMTQWRGNVFRAGAVHVVKLLLSYANYSTTFVFVVILSLTCVILQNNYWAILIAGVVFLLIALIDSYLQVLCLQSQCLIDLK